MIRTEWHIVTEDTLPANREPVSAVDLLLGAAEGSSGETSADEQTVVEEGTTVTTEHTIVYTLSRLTGRMTVTVDGDTYTLPAGLFACKAARREPFRLVGADGEAEQAVLVVDKKGKASLLFRAETVAPIAQG